MSEHLPFEEREFVHSRLQGDIETIRAYGDEHRDEWTEVLFENEPAVRIVALFAGPHLEEHDRALRRLVDHPDFLEVRQTQSSRTQLERMLAEARQLREGPGGFLMSGIARGKLHLHLGADEEALAATLLEKFGAAADVTVGAFAFPMPTDSGVRTPTPRPDVEPISLEQVDVSLSDQVTVASGQIAHGSLEFSNHGAKEVTLDTNGVVTARIVNPSTLEVVGGFVGAQAMPLFQYLIAPGASVAVPLLVGTASFIQSLGYSVPPGEWMMDAIVTVRDRGERRIPPLPIVIVARFL